MKWTIVIALIISTVGSTVLMGLPGAIVLEFSQALIKPFNLELLCMKGDAGWPSAILISAICPLSLPLAYYLAFKRCQRIGRIWQMGIFVSVLLITGILLTMILECISRKDF